MGSAEIRSSFVSSPWLVAILGASKARNDRRGPLLIRSRLQSFKATIGCPMHAAALGRKLVYEAFATAKAASDLAGTPVGALGTALELGLIRQAMAQPAAEARSAIQDTALAMASGHGH